MSKAITLADIQEQMETVDWLDTDNRPLIVKVEQVSDGIGAEFTRADDPEWAEWEFLGETPIAAMLEAQNRTSPTEEELIEDNIAELNRANDLFGSAIRALLDERGVSEVTLGKLYIYATVDGSADVIERDADHA